MSQRSRRHQEQGGHTHSAQPGLGPGPSCHVSAGTGILVSRKPSPGGRGARGPPSRTSSGLLCTVSTGGRRGENREDKNRHSRGPSGHALTRDTQGSSRARTRRDTRTHAGVGGPGSLPGRGGRGWRAALTLAPRPDPLWVPQPEPPYLGWASRGPAPRPSRPQLCLGGQRSGQPRPGPVCPLARGRSPRRHSRLAGMREVDAPAPAQVPGFPGVRHRLPFRAQQARPARSSQGAHPAARSTRPPAGSAGSGGC